MEIWLPLRTGIFLKQEKEELIMLYCIIFQYPSQKQTNIQSMKLMGRLLLNGVKLGNTMNALEDAFQITKNPRKQKINLKK